MGLVVENNSIGILDGNIGNSDTTITLQSMTGMPVLTDPSDFCILTLIRASDGALEWVKCTSQDVPSRTYTVTRAQEGSTALSFLSGDEVRNLWTKGQIELLNYNEDTNLMLADGTVAMVGDLDLNSNSINNINSLSIDGGKLIDSTTCDLGGTSVTNSSPGLTANDLTTLSQVQSLISAGSNGAVLYNQNLNGLSDVDVTWQASWDSYDYVHLVVVGAVSSTATQIAFALSSDAGTSWENFLGSTDEAISWTSSGISSNKRFDGRFEMNLKSTLKVPYAQHFASDFLIPTASTGFSQGITLNYDGSFLSGSTSPDKWRGWDTGTSGLNGYTLRFVGESANFTSGSLRIIGYNYPT